jgi:hypothetical protein
MFEPGAGVLGVLVRALKIGSGITCIFNPLVMMYVKIPIGVGLMISIEIVSCSKKEKMLLFLNYILALDESKYFNPPLGV